MKNTLILFQRLMRHISRSPETIASAVVQPTLIMLLFVFVFGGAIKASLPDGVNYVNFQLPGILVMAIAYNTSYTSLRIFSDKGKGIWARLDSMPINRSSPLWAHVLASIASSLLSLAVVFSVALAIGFRTGAGFLAWLAVLGILAALSLALTWVAVIPGLVSKSTDGASFLAFPLVFLPLFSSSFAPTETMPYFLRIFAENQPVTPIVGTIRSLFGGEPVGGEIWVALAWCAGIMAVAWVAAMKIYKSRAR